VVEALEKMGIGDLVSGKKAFGTAYGVLRRRIVGQRNRVSGFNRDERK